jgi:very-short-patch-repair endonuclease
MGAKGLNELEQKFYDAYIYDNSDEFIKPQAVIGIYVVDFLISPPGIVVEIDGYEYHKTKEQRERDYNRERYFLKNGYIHVRFTGTEVFLDVDRCVHELGEIDEAITNQRIADYELGKKEALEWVSKG